MENEFKYNDLIIRMRWLDWRHGREFPYRFRNGPVPLVTKCRWKKSYNRWRGDSLTNNRNGVYIFDEDDDILITDHQKEVIQNTFLSRHTKKTFPDIWDDRCKFDYKDRSWKRYRKTRWK